VFSDNVDLQRSASLTFAEITERGTLTIYMGDKRHGWDRVSRSHVGPVREEESLVYSSRPSLFNEIARKDWELTVEHILTTF
jgi:hypothetical protein